MTLTQAGFRRDAMLEEYRVRRWRDEDAREDRDIGYKAERAMHKADGVKQPVTFREFLAQHQPPAPDPAEVEAVSWVAAWDAQAEWESARDELEARAARRDETIAALVATGLTLQQVADIRGVSKQQISKWVAADRRRRKAARNGGRT